MVSVLQITSHLGIAYEEVISEGNQVQSDIDDSKGAQWSERRKS